MRRYKTLPAYQLDTHGMPDEEAIERYNRDGVVCLTSAFDDHWVGKGRRAVAAALRHQTKSQNHFSHQHSDERGRFFYDTFLWKRLPSFQDFTFNSPAANLAKSVMQSKQLLLYFDMVIVKEPGTSAITPWHYDEAYWPVSGTQICNIWIALDYVPKNTALKFVSGSHKMDDEFRAVDFFTATPKAGQTKPSPPDWDSLEGDHTILSRAMNPGDCVIINLRTHHSAPGNLQKNNRRRAICTHWFGDDARFDNKPWKCHPDERGENLVDGGRLECTTFPRVL